MHKILVIIHASNLNGGVSVSQQVVEFDNQGARDVAIDQINHVNFPREMTVTVIKLC